MEQSYSLRSPGVKRLMQEAKELSTPTELFFAKPLEDNLFEWHFTVRGPPDTEFEGGIYHGRIILPTEYPMKPPSILLLTPNGRFELNKKICLSISGYHPEMWQPSWSIRTALLAIIGFMPTPGVGALGALDYTPEERRTLAQKSKIWKCAQCGVQMCDILPELTQASASTSAEARELGTKLVMKAEVPKSEMKQVESDSTNLENDRDDAVTNAMSADAGTAETFQSTPTVANDTIAANNGRQAFASYGRANLANNNNNHALVTNYFLWASLIILLALLVRRFMLMHESEDSYDVIASSSDDAAVIGLTDSETN